VSGLKDPKVATVKANSVLHLDLSYEIKERTSKDIFANFDFASMEAENNLGLNDIIKNIRKAHGRISRHRLQLLFKRHKHNARDNAANTATIN
jgi:hypothetical protein